MNCTPIALGSDSHYFTVLSAGERKCKRWGGRRVPLFSLLNPSSHMTEQRAASPPTDCTLPSVLRVCPIKQKQELHPQCPETACCRKDLPKV